MHFTQLFDFLRQLQQNNNKQWMDLNRGLYESVRDKHIAWLDKMNLRLAALDDGYMDTPGKKGINRINNNLVFHPNKPVYKDHFGAGLDQISKQNDFYIHIGTTGCFFFGGFYKPDGKTLTSIREAIDYNGNKFVNILNKPSFIKAFGALIDDGEKLKTAPKGYSQTHEHIDLLRYKTFAVEFPLTEKKVLSSQFEDLLIKVYFEMLPFRRYLSEAVTV